jgi:hypothetical protein
VTPSKTRIRRDALREGDSAPKSTKFIGNVVFWPLRQGMNSRHVRNWTRAVDLS